MGRAKIPRPTEVRISRVYREGMYSRKITLPKRFLEYMEKVYGEFEYIELILVREGPAQKPVLLLRPYIPSPIEV